MTWGARNLFIWLPLDKIWLNHNWHQTHHEHPTVPWTYLPRLGREKWLSGDRIHVRITCWAGMILIVESQVGRAKTTMFLALTPNGPIVTASPIFGTWKSRVPGLDRLKLRIISWLFSHVMYKDVSIVEDMRFKVVMADQAPGSPLRCFLDFLDGLAVETGS